MPVHLLLYWTVADGAGQRSAFDALSDALACMGSVSPARWSAQASLLRAAAAAAPRGTEDPQAARAAPGAEGAALHRVSFSDEPGQLFLLSRAAGQVIQAGADMQAAFLERQYRQRGGMALDGSRHSLGDFSVCLARAVQAPQQSFLGLAVDLCYLPLDDAAAAAPLLQDMAAILQEAAEAAGGQLRQVPDTGGAFRLPAAAGARHRAVQHVALLQQLLDQGT